MGHKIRQLEEEVRYLKRTGDQIQQTVIEEEHRKNQKAIEEEHRKNQKAIDDERQESSRSFSLQTETLNTRYDTIIKPLDQRRINTEGELKEKINEVKSLEEEIASYHLRFLKHESNIKLLEQKILTFSSRRGFQEDLAKVEGKLLEIQTSYNKNTNMIIEQQKIFNKIIQLPDSCEDDEETMNSAILERAKDDPRISEGWVLSLVRSRL